MPSITLLSCAHCGGDANTFTLNTHAALPQYHVECYQCGMRTLPMSKKDAESRWNKRIKAETNLPEGVTFMVDLMRRIAGERKHCASCPLNEKGWCPTHAALAAIDGCVDNTPEWMDDAVQIAYAAYSGGVLGPESKARMTDALQALMDNGYAILSPGADETNIQSLLREVEGTCYQTLLDGDQGFSCGYHAEPWPCLATRLAVAVKS